MLILLIIYLIFLGAYVIFSVYSMLRIWSMRMRNDKSGNLILTYLVTVAVIVAISLIFVAFLSWPMSFNILGGKIGK